MDGTNQESDAETTFRKPLRKAHKPPPFTLLDGLVEEFQYHVNVRAKEAFINSIRKEGILMPEMESSDLTFPSYRLLDMKSYKERGILWSYSIVRVRRSEEIIEEG